MKSIKMFGKSVPLIAILVISLLAVGASAILLTQYGQIGMTATMDQSVLVDGGTLVTDTLINEFTGRTYCFPHTLENRADVDAPISLTHASLVNYDGITVSYLKPLVYETTVSTDYPTLTIPAEITVAPDVTGDYVVWTIDIDMTDYVSFAWGGHLGYGLVISKDGVNPAFQVHGNDGVDHAYAFGTHLYSKWGPTLLDGYNGWHTGTGGNNIPVADIGWIDCTGDRQIVAGDYDDYLPIHSDGNPDGVFTISIKKCYLGEQFSWAVQVMGQTSDTHYPTAWAMWSGDSSTFPVVEIAEDISSYTLAMSEFLDFYIVYDFDVAVTPSTYPITTTVNVE